jgi:uncharacterized protein (TIGR02598 family)
MKRRPAALIQVAQHGCRKSLHAFSLVEVVLALVIVSFAMLGIVALLPAGAESTRDSLAESGAINVLSAVLMDRRTTNPTAISTLYQIPSLSIGSSNSFAVTAANTNSSDFSQSAYRVTYVITPPDPGRLDPYQIYVKVSWPAAAPALSAAGYVEASANVAQP